MAEGLGLGLGCGGSSQSRLCFGGGAGLREELDFFVDGAAEVVEGLADVGWVVVGFVGVLGAALDVTTLYFPVKKGNSIRHLEKLLVHELQGIHSLLKLNVLVRELGLVLDLAQLLSDHLLRARSKG